MERVKPGPDPGPSGGPALWSRRVQERTSLGFTSGSPGDGVSHFSWPWLAFLSCEQG